MTILGIAESTVASLVRPVTDTLHDRDAVALRFAHGVWTSVAEPGDRIAAQVVQALGAESALAQLIDDRDGTLLRHALADSESGADLDDSELDAAIARWVPRLSKADAVRVFTQAARFGVSLVTPSDPDWPVSLDDLGDHSPVSLWLRGNRDALGAFDRSIALVGARAATGYGEHVAVEASAGLVDRGHAIVSGAAYGIDGAAHRAALASRGTTIAFLAGGLDRFYPSGHDALLTRIVESGAAISEVPCGVAPTRWRFLQRNRLISAASRAVVVVEAGARSGSLNTAGHAAALGRPLGAVPGPVTSSASAGCHRLLREFGAQCVTNADEMAELAPLENYLPLPGIAPDRDDEASEPAPARAASGDPNGTRLRILDALSARSARTPEKVAALAGLAVDRVRAELGHLELDGTVRARAGSWVKMNA